MKAWSRVERLDDRPDKRKAQLDGLARQGWDLMLVAPAGTGDVAYLKAKGEVVDWSYWKVPLHEDTPNDPDAAERQLNLLGAEGWELVAVTDGVAYLKRPKTPEHGNAR